MNGNDIKRVIAKLEPDREMADRISEKLVKKPKRRVSIKPAAAIAAALVIMIGAGTFVNSNFGKVDQNKVGIYIPQVQISENTEVKAKMIGLIVYQGRIYTQSALQIDANNAEKLIGEKLGMTKANITEWSKQDDYAVELASTVGVQAVYTVKGYDKSYRIMTCEKINGETYAFFYECLNGLTVKTGNDIFEKFKMENNIESVKYENFGSWNNGKNEVQSLTNPDGVNHFLAALENAVPNTRESLPDLFEDQGETSQKFIYVTLNDGSKVQLRLFKEGYVYYNGVDLFFKVDSNAFMSFWNELI
ncbi:MAG: hypothetical protein FNP40_15220 [Dehalobacter sp. 4CP]|uniref:hypothetical protein n=1 Tax=Dehalobacter sp. CP TaxID=2594474 RepID=UPI0013CBC51B|nr:hypothetical protein [Dehalobacter sp.]NBJ16876.1 hypothetical protein [Dehalobacter sp. 4CP]